MEHLFDNNGKVMAIIHDPEELFKHYTFTAELPIKGIQKTSLIDYPGRICCTIFLGGCNFRCGYCYNRDLVLNWKKTMSIPKEDVLAFLQMRKNVLDGVCITGGEPTLHKALPDLIRKIKALGYAVKLDTNGTNPEMIEYLINNELVDYIAMDVKAPIDKYELIAQVRADITKILKTVSIIKNSGVEYEFRMTVVPKLIDERDIVKVSKLLRGCKRFYLQQFMPADTLIDPELKNEAPYSYDEFEKFRSILKREIGFVGIRGF